MVEGEKQNQSPENISHEEWFKYENYPFSFPIEPYISFDSRHKSKRYNLHTYKYPQNAEFKRPKGIIIILSGYGCYVGCYRYYAQILAEFGFTSVGYDYRGFGKSAGHRGKLGSMEELVDELQGFILSVRNEEKEESHPIPPVFLMGFHFGGLLASKLSLVAPGSTDFKPTRRKIFKTIGGLFNPLLSEVGVYNMKIDHFTSDPHISKFLQNDKTRVTTAMRYKTAHELLNAEETICKNFGAINEPIIMAIGDSDKILDSKGIINLYNKHENPWNKMLLIENGEQDICYKEESAEAISDALLTWLNTYILNKYS